jgi:hypothetical protein
MAPWAGEGDDNDEEIRLCRIEYLGDDDWAFALYDPAAEKYDNAVLRTGAFGSAVDALTPPQSSTSPTTRSSSRASRGSIRNFYGAALGGENSKRGFCAFVVLPGYHSAAYRHRTEDGVAPLDERRAGARQDGLPHGPVQLGEEARRGLLHLPQCGAVAAEEGDAGRLGLGDPG